MQRSGYEGLLLAAVILVTGFLTLPATRAGAPASGLALPPLPARVFSACLVFSRGRALLHRVLDRRTPDAAP